MLEALVFDAYGTLFDLAALTRACQRVWPDNAHWSPTCGAVLSVDSLAMFKPTPTVYQFASRSLGAEPRAVLTSLDELLRFAR